MLAPVGMAAIMLMLPACTPDPQHSPSPNLPSESGPNATPAEISAIVEPLQLAPDRTRVEAVGTSRALRSVELHPAVTGEVVAVNFEPGQRVGRGDVLLALDSRDERLAVELSEVRLQDAQRLHERYQRAGDSGAIIPTDMDAARTAVEAARIELDRARVALDYHTIEAPFAGYVGITDVDVGDRIGADTAITTLDDRSALLVTFQAPELLIGQLGEGDVVEVAPWSGGQSAVQGRIVEIDSRIDPATRSFVARARVDNPSDRLRPGMSFRVSINLGGTPHPVIAETGVQWGASGAYVWVVSEGRARRVPVAIVQRQQGRVLVDADLGAGDLIVIEGTQRMREGIAVDYRVAGSSGGAVNADAVPAVSD